ncbi:MAG: GNAT family N-acetyltransferase [Limnochordales bacterium]|nr:GNAT family N-acetyltransferase [Limnochordales bacterium]
MAIPRGSLEIQGATVLLRPFSVTDLAWLKRFLESPQVRQLFGSGQLGPGPAPAGSRTGAGSSELRRGVRKSRDLLPVDWPALTQWYRQIVNDPDSLLLAVTTWSGHLLGYLLLRDIDRLVGRARLEVFFGDRQLWGRGYEEDALQTLLRYAFSSLGLAELQLILPASEAADAAWLAACAARSGFAKATGEGATGNNCPGSGRELWVAEAGALTGAASSGA